MKKNRRSAKKNKPKPMDRMDIHQVKIWFERMLLNAERAVDLGCRISVQDLNESNDLFWALAKYSENVQESIVQLDNINKHILPGLIEIPLASEESGDAAWKDLKGMRSRLVHQFWNVDATILSATVNETFPKLISLLSTLRIPRDPIDTQKPLTGGFAGHELLNLGASDGQESPKPGKSLVFLYFDLVGKPLVFRLAYKDKRTLLVWTSEPLTLSRMYKLNRNGKREDHIGDDSRY